MKALTKTSINTYQKLLKNIIDIPLFEIFLDIGIELVEMEPEEQYVHYLIEMMQEKHTLDSIEELNMKFRQVQNFYNGVIATYDKVDMFEPSEEAFAPIEEIIATLMQMQELERNYVILLHATSEAVDAVADEYGFLDEAYEMEEATLKKYLKKEVFEGVEGLYINFISLYDMHKVLLSKEGHEEHDLYATAILLVLNLSMFNMLRKERFILEQERDKVKIGRNDPCYCGSGKKYKKCCGA